MLNYIPEGYDLARVRELIASARTPIELAAARAKTEDSDLWRSAEVQRLREEIARKSLA